MKYENPEMEILLLKEESIIVTSLTGDDTDVSTEGNVGGGTSAGGGWVVP